MAPNKWLAIGLAYDLLEADIMQWVAGPTSLETDMESVDLQQKIELRGQSQVHDRISVHGVLLDNIDDHLRSLVQLDDAEKKVRFTTWRPFDTNDALDWVIKLDEIIPISIASGSADTEWSERIDHGQIELYLSSVPI